MNSADMALREVASLTLPDVTPKADIGPVPRFVEIEPSMLLVDEQYQRNLSERSINLIRRIVAEWDWRAFKPPIVAQINDEYHVIDGQHTAIAAASHPQIDSIPIMLVDAPEVSDRAQAFVRHNRDRLGISATQLHYAMVAAGDPDAVTVQQVCDRAGATVLKLPPAQGRFKPGQTMAVATLRSLVNRRFAKGARQVVEVCVKAQCAPVGVNVLKAVEELLFAQQYAGAINADDIASALMELGPSAERKATSLAAEKYLPLWKALTIVLFQHCKGGRRGPATKN